MPNSEEVKWENNGIGGFTDYSEGKNDSSVSSVKLSAKHIKKLTVAVDEDVDDRSESCESDNCRIFQTSFTEQQDNPELPQFS